MVRLLLVIKTLSKALVFALVALLLSSGALLMADPSATERQQRIKEESAQRNALRERISKAEKKVVITRLLEDESLREDILDIILIQQRQGEPSRPFREYLAERKGRSS